MKKFFKLGLLFSIGIFIYLKELIAALLILKLTNFETALIFSISLLASTINLKHNKNLFSFLKNQLLLYKIYQDNFLYFRRPYTWL